MHSEVMRTVYTNVESMQVAVSSIMVPLRLTPRLDVPFHVHVGSAQAGEVIVTHIEGAQGQVDRRRKLITSTDPELFMVTLHRQGTVIVEQEGRRHLARPKDLVFFDTTRPYRLRYDDPCDVVVITVPWTSFGPQANALSRQTATPLASDSGTRAVVSAFLTGLGNQLPDMPGPSGVRFGEALTSLLVSVIDETSPDQIDTCVDLTDRIVTYVLANLADPKLCVESVARRFGISPRTLHRLFARRGDGFANWIREERLHRIRRDLSDPAFAQRTVAAIAARWGLYDPSHLSRTFKTRFGQTPAEIRPRAATERPVDPVISSLVR